MASTWNIYEGYLVDCACEGADNTAVFNVSGDSTFNFDDSNIVAKLDELINNTQTNRVVMQNIFDELDGLQDPQTQNILVTSSVGTIPNNVVNYTIVNLGTDPNDENSPRNSYTLGSNTIYSKVISLGNTGEGAGNIANGLNYDPNGNTLMIIYNIK